MPRVGMHPVTLRVTVDAERPWRHSHAERGNDLTAGFRPPLARSSAHGVHSLPARNHSVPPVPATPAGKHPSWQTPVRGRKSPVWASGTARALAVRFARP